MTRAAGARRAWRRDPLILLFILCVALAACAGPVGTKQVDPRVVQADVGRSATTTGDPSWPKRNVLFEYGLSEVFDEHPEDALARMHKAMVATQGDPDLLFALAELSYIYGRAADKRDYLLAATIYNWSLAAALVPPGGLEVVPRGGRFELPFGPIEVAWDPTSLRAGNREIYNFIPVAELKVSGMAMRYRWSGLGAPLAASTRLIDP